jgi:dihydroneopterin aldolase
MTLKLNGIEVACIIGDRPDERVRLQTLRIDAELEIPSDAATSDHLAETIDYAALTDAIRASLVAAKCQMIERAAKISFDVCAAACRPVAGARPLRVTVTKSGAIPGLASASACYP